MTEISTPPLQFCTADPLASVFAGSQEEIIAEWRLQAGELLRDPPRFT